MYGALVGWRLKGEVDHSKCGGYSLVTNTWWLFWMHGPVGWKGANKVGGDVNVVNAWKVPGDVVREAGALNTSEPHTCRHHATLVLQTSFAARKSTAPHPAICSGPGGRVSIVTDLNVVAFLGLRAGPRQGEIVVRLGRLGQPGLRFPAAQRHLPPGCVC